MKNVNRSIYLYNKDNTEAPQLRVEVFFSRDGDTGAVRIHKEPYDPEWRSGKNCIDNKKNTRYMVCKYLKEFRKDGWKYLKTLVHEGVGHA